MAISYVEEYRKRVQKYGLSTSASMKLNHTIYFYPYFSPRVALINYILGKTSLHSCKYHLNTKAT